MENQKFAIKDSFLEQLREWGTFLTPFASEGADSLCLSYRYAQGYIVSKEGAFCSDLKKADLLFVESWEFLNAESPVYGSGRLSKTGLIHAPVFKNRSGAIFSFYLQPKDISSLENDASLKKVKGHAGVEILAALEAAIGQANVFYLADLKAVLGFGCTSNDAGKEILRALGRLAGTA